MDSNVFLFSVLLFFPGVSLFSLALHIVLSGFQEVIPAKVYFGGLVYFYCLVMLYVAVKTYFLPVWSFRTFFEIDLLILLMELPFTYMYIRLLIKPGDRFFLHLVKHQFPFLVLSVVLVIIHMCSLVAEKKCGSLSEFFRCFTGIEDYFSLICLIVFIIQLSCYAILVFGLIKDYKGRVSRIPGFRPVPLRWMYVIVLLLTAFTIVFVYYIFSISDLSRLIVAILAFVLLNIAAICGSLYLNIPVQFCDKTGLPVLDMKEEDSVEERILQRLNTLFEQEHIYREFDLHLEDVAARVGSNRTYVSAVINNKYRVNFFRFVNGYRIREAQQLMFTTTGPIYEIACIVGFKSISTFNYQFKEYVGMSPKEWRMAVRNDMNIFVKSGIDNC